MPDTGTAYKKRVPKSPEEYVAYVHEFIQHNRRFRSKFERDWLLSMCRFLGLHYYNFFDDGTFREPQVPIYRIRLVVNLVLSTIETMCSKILRNRPQADVRPASTDDEDQVGAKLGMRVYESLTEEAEYDRKVETWVKWAAICGTGFFQTGWDGRDGAEWKDDDPESGEAQAYYMGKLDLSAVSPFDLIVEAGAEHINDAKKACRRRRMLLEDVRERWPEKSDELRPMQPSDEMESLDERLTNLGLGPSENATDTDLRDYVMVHELWELPKALSAEEREEWPQGRVIICAGQVHLATIHHPYKHGQLPWVQMNAINVPGRLYGLSVIDEIGNLNRGLNRALSKAMEALVLMSNPQVSASVGSLQGRNAVTSEPGSILRHPDGSNPVQLLSPPSLVGAGHFEVMKLLQAYSEEVSGLREVSRGSAPAGVTSGVAINLLQENDDSRLGVQTIRGFERAYQRQGKQVLEIAQQYIVEPRLLKITGEDGEFDTIDFMGRDIRGNTDFRVVPGSAMPQSRVAKIAEIMDFYKLQIIPNDDRGRLLTWRLMNMANLELLWKEEQADLNCADRENLRMKHGLPQTVYLHQDHDIHKARVDLIRKRADWSTKPPDIQKLFNDHYEAHEMAQIEVQIAEARKQQSIQMAIQAIQPQMGAAPGVPGAAPAAMNGGAPPQGPGISPEAMIPPSETSPI